MATKRQANRHSGIGALIQKRGRWYIVGHEITTGLDGKKIVRRPAKALPKEITTKAEAVREFNRRATEARAGKGHHRPTSRTVKALCEAWQADTLKPQPLGLSTARQWATHHGAKDLYNYTTPDLVAFRKAMEESEGMTRGTINSKIGWIRTIAKWGIVHGYAPPDLLPKLQALPPLKAGSSRAAEGKGRGPADAAAFNAALPHLASPYREILQIIRWTAARPSEILTLTPEEVDTSDLPWVITKKKHKTASKGFSRVFFLPAAMNDVLEPFLDLSPCFTVNGRAISAEALRLSLRYACEAAGVTVVKPYELRHLRSTEIAEHGSKEMAQAAAGHSTATMTNNYTKEADARRRLELARQAAMVGAGE